jgi:hypothetical protein
MPYFFLEDLGAEELRAHRPDLGDSELARVEKALEDRGMMQSWHMLGAAEQADCPVATIVHMPPGVVIPRHAHGCHRLEMVVRGSITVLETGRTLGPGDAMVTDAGVFYGPHVTGPDGCATVEVLSRRDRWEPYTEDGTPMVEAFVRENKGVVD